MTGGSLQEAGHDAESIPLTREKIEAMLADTKAVLPPEWRLTHAEDRIFRVLLAHDVATREVICHGAKVPASRTIDVHLSRIRKKTTRLGLEIVSMRGRGWSLLNRASWARTLSLQAA